MKSFKLDDNGDLVLNKMVEGIENTLQSTWVVLGIQEGEWMFNEHLGVNIELLLSKNPQPDEVRAEIQNGLLQVDDSFQIESFEMLKVNRKLEIRYSATNKEGENVKGVRSFA